MTPNDRGQRRSAREFVSILTNFIRLVQPSRVLIVFSSFLILVSSLLEALSMGLLIPILDLFVRGGDLSYITGSGKLGLGRLFAWLPEMRVRYIFFLLLSIIMLATTLRHFLLYLSETCVSRVSRRAEHLLRTRIFERYLLRGKRFVDQSNIGGLVDMNIYQTLESCRILAYLHNALLASIMIIVYLSMMSWVSWQLTIVSLLTMPPILILIRMMSGRLANASRHKTEIDQRMSTFVYDTLSNISMVQVSCAEKREADRYSALSWQSGLNLLGIQRKVLFISHAQEIIMTIGIASLVSVCVLFFFAERVVAPASFLIFFILIRRLSSYVSQMGGFVVDAFRYIGPMRSVLSMVDQRNVPTTPSGTKVYQGLQRDIRFDGVRFSYGGHEVLRGIDLTFQKGKVTAIVGPTGSGKSTLVSLLLGFYRPAQGRVLFDGVDMGEYDLSSFRRAVGFVDQSTSIFNTTIRENLLYGYDGHCDEQKLDQVAEKARIHGWIDQLPERYETTVGDKGVRLSGGERQRLAIARALLREPDVFVLDEATSSLDMQTEKDIQTSIESAVKGHTTIVIAHRVSTVKSADHIIFVENGVVAEQGRFDELISLGGRFYHYWQLYSAE